MPANTPKWTPKPNRDGLAARTLWLTAAKFLSFVFAFLLPLLLVRLLNQTEFGLYKQAFQVLSTLLSLLGFQVVATIYYFLPREVDRKPQVVMNVLLFYTICGLAVTVFFALNPRWITVIFRNDDLVPNVPLLGIALLVYLISNGIDSFMIVNSETRLASFVILALQIAKTTLLIGAALMFGTVRAVVIAGILHGGLQALTLVIYLYRRFGQFWRGFDWGLFKAQIANALPFGLGSLAATAQVDLHYYFVSHYFDSASFAIYSVGCFQLPLLMILVDSAESVLFPEIALRQKDGAYHRMTSIWMNGVRGLAFFFVPAAVFMFIVRTEFITTLFTTNYSDAVPIFAINLINVLLWMNLSAPMVRAFPELRYFRFKLYLFLFPLNWFALYFGIQAAGLVGAMAATALIRVLDVVITSAVLARRLQLRVIDLKPLAPTVRIAAASLAAGAVTFLVKLTLAGLPGIATLGVCTLVFGVSYLILAFNAGAITPDEKFLLRSRLSAMYRTGFSRLGLSSASGVSSE